MLIGYARVLTVDQNLALQRDALTEAGCEKIFTEQRGVRSRIGRPCMTLSNSDEAATR
jgi:DNA invertase Pin-like site-specific DNA recombinase